jgi:hypothetical protein
VHPGFPSGDQLTRRAILHEEISIEFKLACQVGEIADLRHRGLSNGDGGGESA